jgi:hypothetical protein
MSGQVSLGDIVVQVLNQPIGEKPLSSLTFPFPFPFPRPLYLPISLSLSPSLPLSHACTDTHARCESLLLTKAARMHDVSACSPTMRLPRPR